MTEGIRFYFYLYSNILIFFLYSAAKFTVPENTKWVKINYKQAGYYRVNYTGELWEKLTEHYYVNIAINSRFNIWFNII